MRRFFQAVGSADLADASSVEQLKTTTTYSKGGRYGHGRWRKRRKRWADEYDDRYYSRYSTTTVNWEKANDFFNNDEREFLLNILILTLF